MPPPKGVSNNPYGRPVGSKNKVTHASKLILQRIFADNEEALIDDLNQLRLKKDYRNHARLVIEIGKIITPRPQNEDDKAWEALRSEFVDRLFGRKEEEKEY